MVEDVGRVLNGDSLLVAQVWAGPTGGGLTYRVIWRAKEVAKFGRAVLPASTYYKPYLPSDTGSSPQAHSQPYHKRVKLQVSGHIVSTTTCHHILRIPSTLPLSPQLTIASWPRIRKVKCDEAKPACARCVSTGRKCDGYAAQLSPGLTWYRPTSVFQSVNAAGEGRALDFFCSVVAPVLAGPLDPYFWTHLVVQFANFEPAVRHSLVAISALYEDASLPARPGALVPRIPAPRLADNPFGLYHYNAAIAKLKELKNDPLVLLVCVLFVCIECLQGQTEAALEHSQHGISILANVTKAFPWTTEYLTPIFRRLSVLPFFWGIRTFPLMKGLDVPVPARFATIAEAQDSIDALTTRMAHLLRMADIFRYGERRHLPVPPGLASVQQAVREALRTWQLASDGLASRAGISEYQDAAYCNLLVKFDLCQIWTEQVFDPKEVSYDAYFDRFATMVRRATQVGDMVLRSRALVSKGPAFSFETWLLPFMYFVVMKCRHLATRLQALSLIKEHGAARENLWNVGNMYPIGRRLIEIEHELVLDETGWPVEPVPPICLAPPPEGKRVRDLWSRPHVVKQKEPDGREVRGFPAGFVMLDDDGGIWNRVELITAMDQGADDTESP